MQSKAAFSETMLGLPTTFDQMRLRFDELNSPVFRWRFEQGKEEEQKSVNCWDVENEETRDAKHNSKPKLFHHQEGFYKARDGRWHQNTHSSGVLLILKA